MRPGFAELVRVLPVGFAAGYRYSDQQWVGIPESHRAANGVCSGEGLNGVVTFAKNRRL